MFEPFPGNYIWNLATNLALCCGGNHGEIDEANRPIREAAKAGSDAGSAQMFDSWVRVANQVAANGAVDEAAGRLLSAGTKYLRAAGYFLAAERMQSRDHPLRKAAYDRGLELYHKGAKLRGHFADYVEIPYGDTSFPGIFIHDGSGTPRPTLVAVNGLDSMKEQAALSGMGLVHLERGMNTFIIDQPGTGEAIRRRGMPAIFDSEQWGSAAYDYLLTRSDVVHSKVGVYGPSFGGYHAPRVVANDPRYALCAVLGANHVWGERQRQRVANEGENPVPHYWDHVMWVFGFDDRDAFLAYADQITLDGQVEKITAPFLITHGENDRQIPVANAHRSYEQATASAKRTLRIFTQADFEVEHCGADNGTVMRDYVADWCAETFAELG
ncbi:alpha/beta hydrolase [Sphingobium sp.]|uniref:alpha/beta hydrolase n=1 Tax=Sphingobium sp. TaxID=1912891 RepID=UPI0028BD4A4A|nr:alpha/beta hydrolase [Sphingobium sp.]